jgi:hypothetical protein
VIAEAMTTLALALVLFTAAPAHQDQPARAEPADIFAIYLVAEPVDPRITGYGKGDWSQLRLSATPLITGADIVSYDLAKHAMKLRPEALARIPKPPVDGMPFVVVAQGRRVYLGAFVTIISSRTFAVPSIMVDRGMLHPTEPKDTLVIDPAYPSPQFAVGPDPRGDDRIKAAIQKLKGGHYAD